MFYYTADTVREVANGNWLFILEGLAPHLEQALRKPGRHVSCPVHGGKDGFRLFKDVPQTGGGVCNTCGTRYDGFELLMWLNHWNFKQCLSAVGDYLGVEKEKILYQARKQHHRVKANLFPMFREPPKPWLLEIQEKMKKKMASEGRYSARLCKRIEKVWNECLPFSSHVTEPMRLYFKNRSLLFRVDEVEKSDCLRFNPAMPYYDEEGHEVGKFPAIVCAIRDIDGNLVTLQRTYITQSGEKAKVGNAKKMMPIPKGLDVNGAAIRLGEPTEGILGVSEGLETALSAYRMSQIPVWSTVNATLMTSFEVPEGIHTVLIWADKDHSATGEKAANVLKARLEKRGIEVYVLMPQLTAPPGKKGIDWNDVLMRQGSFGFPNPLYLRDFMARRREDTRH